MVNITRVVSRLSNLSGTQDKTQKKILKECKLALPNLSVDGDDEFYVIVTMKKDERTSKAMPKLASIKKSVISIAKRNGIQLSYDDDGSDARYELVFLRLAGN